MSNLHVIDHPLITHKLSIMRNRKTGSKDFRELLNEIAMLMGYEVFRDLPLEEITIETPITRMKAKMVSGRKLAIVPILRAGLGMVDGLQNLVPVAKVGHIGMYRDPETHKPVEYYCKLPTDIEERLVVLVDPMLATGGSAVDALCKLKGTSPPPRWTSASTSTPTSCPVWATRATASSARCKRPAADRNKFFCTGGCRIPIDSPRFSEFPAKEPVLCAP